jgi:hypothetical protein
MRWTKARGIAMIDSKTVSDKGVSGLTVPGQAGPPAVECGPPEAWTAAPGAFGVWTPESALGLTCAPCRAASAARGVLVTHPHRVDDRDQAQRLFAEWTAAGDPPW